MFLPALLGFVVLPHLAHEFALLLLLRHGQAALSARSDNLVGVDALAVLRVGVNDGAVRNVPVPILLVSGLVGVVVLLVRATGADVGQ